MESPSNVHQLVEAELQRVYGNEGHVNVVVQTGISPAAADMDRALAILRSLPDGAGQQAVIRAFGIPPDQVRRRGGST
jgi:hypothetical protein